MKKRIWELDALRGICILGMVVFHLLYNLTSQGVVSWQLPEAVLLIRDVGGRIFLLLSGLCATIGTRSVRRGGIVFGAGMLCTLVTWGMYRLGFAGYNMVIRFGVLHCLGICMLLWPVFKRLPAWALAVLGAVIVAVGVWFDVANVYGPEWLFPLGILHAGFASGDFFPLFPCLGWFLLGAVVGRTLYRRKTSLLPGLDGKNALLRFFCRCGQLSLPIYLVHQPVLYGLVALFTL